MVVLKKLKYWLNTHLVYHYHFKMPKEAFFELLPKGYNVIINDDTVEFFGNKKLSLKLKENNEIIINNVLKHFINYLFVKRLMFTLLFLLIIITFFSSSKIIREIKFTDELHYDKRIYDYVYKKLDKKLFFFTYEKDLNLLSLELRATFPNYAYIGVTRNSSCLLIEIEKFETINNLKNNVNNLPCDLVSKYDCVVHDIKATSGVVLVELNQFVKKGETLISGNLNINNNPKDYSNLVASNGIIIGETIEYKSIKVPKSKSIFTYTGKLTTKYNVSFKDHTIFDYADVYENQKVVITEIFSLFKLLKLHKEAYYEMNYVDVIYDYDNAYNYSISLLYYELDLNRVSDKEQILEIKLLNYYENNDEFIFNLLVKKLQNICLSSYY